MKKVIMRCALLACLLLSAQGPLQASYAYRVTGMLTKSKEYISGAVKVLNSYWGSGALYKRLDKELPFAKIGQDGQWSIFFDPKLFFSDVTKQKLTEAIERSAVEGPVFVGKEFEIVYNLQSLPNMGVSVVTATPLNADGVRVTQQGHLIRCSSTARDLFNGKEQFYAFKRSILFGPTCSLFGYPKMMWRKMRGLTSKKLEFDHALAVFYHELGHAHYQHCTDWAITDALLGKSKENILAQRRLNEFVADGFVVDKGGPVLGKKLRDCFNIRQVLEHYNRDDRKEHLDAHPLSRERVAYLNCKIKEKKQQDAAYKK